MSKPVLIMLSSCLLTTLLCCWIITPNLEQRAKHQATLCNVVRIHPELNHKEELLEHLKFSYDNSTPSYAYYHPKFYTLYSQYLIYQWLKQSPAQQQHAKIDYALCRQLLS